jgi:hypothetical protein
LNSFLNTTVPTFSIQRRCHSGNSTTRHCCPDRRDRYAEKAVRRTRTSQHGALARKRGARQSIKRSTHRFRSADALETSRTALDSLRHQLQHWISIPPTSTLDEIGQQLNEQFEQQQPIIPQTVHNETQTVHAPKAVDIGVGTIAIVQKHHQTQIDRPAMFDQQIQTESFDQLWSTVSSSRTNKDTSIVLLASG